MKGYPIILTRTYDCDYFWGFHVKPSFLDQSEAKSFIMAATTQIDNLNGMRQVVFSNDKYSVIGIVAYTVDIIAASSLSSDKKQELEQYTADIRGRKIYGFWGFVCERTQISLCLPSYDDYTDIFCRYVIPVWANKTQESAIEELPVEIKGKIAVGIIPSAEFNYNGKNIYTTKTDMFGAFISKSMTSPISFCSGLVGAKCIRESKFENIQTDSGTISNLKNALEQEKEQEIQRERDRKAMEEEKRLSEQKATEDANKKEPTQSSFSPLQNGISQKSSFGTKSSNTDLQFKQQSGSYGSKNGSGYSGSRNYDEKPWSFDEPDPSSKKKHFTVLSHQESRQQRKGINPLIPVAIGAGVLLIVVIIVLFGENK